MLDTFDVVIELSRKKLLDYILEHVLIQNKPIVPKFQWSLYSQGNGIQAILDSVDLSLQAGTNQATLTFHVYAASVTLAQQPQVGFTDGQILIPLELAVGAPFKVRMQSAQFTTTQTSQLGDPNSFFQTVNALLTGALDTSTEWDLFPDTPNQTLQFLIALALNGRVACFDAETVVATIGTGDLTKVSNFLNFEDCAVGIGVTLVKNTILFPSEVKMLDPNLVAGQLGISSADAASDIQNPTPVFVNSVRPLLPPPFGTGDGRQSNQGFLTFFDLIDFSFTNGAILMTGKFHGGTLCVSVSDGQFNEAVTLSIQNGSVVVTFTPNPPQPTYSEDVSFWCILGALITLNGFVAVLGGAVILPILLAVVEHIQVSQKTLTADPFSLPIFDQVTWNGIQIVTEGLVLRGLSSASVGYDTTLAAMDVKVDTYPLDDEKVGTGQWTFPGNLSCKTQTFSYDEYRQNISYILTPQPTGLLTPIKTTWYVNGVEISGPSGELNFTVLAHMATPPFNEVALPNHPCTVNFTQFGTSDIGSILDLWMPLSDYNFDLPIKLVATDASGHVYTRDLVIQVVTDYVQFGQDYYDFQKNCGLAAKFNIGRIKTIPQGVLRSGDPLTPSEITSIVQEIVATQPANVAIDVVRGLISTYGAAPVLKAFAPVSTPEQQRIGATDLP